MPHRYFTTEIADGAAVLRGSDAHHLARVMRAKQGDTVILCDGNAVEYTATITGLHPLYPVLQPLLRGRPQKRGAEKRALQPHRL